VGRNKAYPPTRRCHSAAGNALGQLLQINRATICDIYRNIVTHKKAPNCQTAFCIILPGRCPSMILPRSLAFIHDVQFPRVEQNRVCRSNLIKNGVDQRVGRLKMREWKMRYGENCKVELAGVENMGANRRGEKCRSGKWGSRSHGWNLQK